MNRKLTNIELNRITQQEYKLAKKIPVVVVLDNVRSQHNIGSVFRTSDAFLIEKVVLCGICATPPTPEIHKSALGAEFSVDWCYFPSTIDAVAALKKEGYIIISVEQTENSVSLLDFSIDPSVKYVLIFGNEVRGVQQDVVDLSDYTLEVPQWGTKHSLNVSVTVGVVLWDIVKKITIPTL